MPTADGSRDAEPTPPEPSSAGATPRPGPPRGPYRLIVNPSAGSGRVRAAVPALRTSLERAGADVDVVEAPDRDGTTEAARASLREGWRQLVAVGGDGTLQAVVNGMFDGDAPIADDAVLGIVTAGHGGDFARTFGLDIAPEHAARRLLAPETMTVDVGVAEFTDAEGRSQRRLFTNCAQVGYGAEVARLAARMPRKLGRVRYLLAAWAAIRKVSRPEATVELEHGRQRVPLVDLVAANGQFFGGGMRVAPRAMPSDGRLSVLAFTGGRSQVFLLTPQMYRGAHLPHPEIREWQTPWVAVAEPPGLRVEADGEDLGWSPARFSLLPGALRLSI